MAKQMIEFEVPDGWEVVSCDPIEDTALPHLKEAVRGPHITLRRKHVWPAWLPPGWVTCDERCRPVWFELRPDIYGNSWHARGGWFSLAVLVRFGSLVLPPLDADWRKNIWEVRHG